MLTPFPIQAGMEVVSQFTCAFAPPVKFAASTNSAATARLAVAIKITPREIQGGTLTAYQPGDYRSAGNFIQHSTNRAVAACGTPRIAAG
jgi:hypothetical protein